MAVVIHDFEMTVQQPSKTEEPNTPAADATHAQPPIRPEDIARIERYYRERRKRIMAT